MIQTAPDPEVLRELVSKLQYKPGWTFVLAHIDRGQGSTGLTLDITTCGYNSYHPEDGENYRVHHYMIVPAAAYDRRSWCRWILEQILLVERHEACEFFQLVIKGEFVRRDGSHSDTLTERPYAPHHGPGNDPYIIFEHGTDEDVRTSFRGTVKTPAPRDPTTPEQRKSHLPRDT